MTDNTDLATPEAVELPGEGGHRDAWVEETTGVDRVISVALTLEQPRTADWIADEAEVSTTTARDHLSRLVELRVLTAVERRGATTYTDGQKYVNTGPDTSLGQRTARNRTTVR
jgi:predicted HTH transcriptional regulator